MPQSKPTSKPSHSIPKIEARQLGRLARSSLSSTEYQNKSAAIVTQLKQLDFRAGSSVHIYNSIRRNQEVDTAECIVWLQTITSNVFVQPVSNDFPAEEFNYIIIPLLLVDRSGSRVGYGGGSYDRFLSEQPISAVRIGLAFECQLSENFIQQEIFDQKVAYIVTEKRLLAT